MPDRHPERSHVRIKLSGITTPEDAASAAEIGVDIVSCVFVAVSPRYVTLTQARAIRDILPSTVTFAGIFADAPPPLVRAIATHAHLDVVQLFGSEPRAVVDHLLPHAYKAATVRDSGELEAVSRTYLGRRSRADLPGLLVHLAADMSTRWDALADIAARTNLLVASPALDAATVGPAIAGSRPWGVDVWESVESAPGHLDAERLRAFADAVRTSERPTA